MTYTEITKPGMGDPYWYEWSVGEQYIIDMLNEDNGISYVELQANVGLGLDDVVVTYDNGEKLFIQVKHTRADNTLSFGDLVKSNESNSSLLYELAQSWYKERDNYQNSKVCLFTNRIVGSRNSSVKKEKGAKASDLSVSKYTRPALSKFWPEMKNKISSAKKLDEICFPEFDEAWMEWKKQLVCINSDEDKLQFLKCLEIDANEPDLDSIKISLLDRIKTVFAADDNNAEIILGNLDHALRTWTTSSRQKSPITAEEVLNALSFSRYRPQYNHDLVPCEPFFESRNLLVESIEKKLREGSKKVFFLSGVPGTGKTNIISKLGSKRDSVIDIRYYAYEPIDPGREYLPTDVSRRVDKGYFWNELFNQLRKCLKGQLYKYKVPAINELMSLDEMRNRFFQIASAYAKARSRSFVIAIDGIDHAARSGNIEQTFLATLPSPEYIPDNVIIIIAGQPKENYDDYPSWLFSNRDDVEEIGVPGLQSEDILSLVCSEFQDIPELTQRQLSDLIAKYAQGNTLAAIFAVHEARQQPNARELEQRFIERKLSGNIEEYYRIIWSDAVKKIGIPFVDYKIAGVMAFFNEPVNENKLCEMFSKERISASNWRNVLKTLRPLLEVNDGQYTILHNDVRVFLTSIIGKDADHVREVYSALCDYYLGCQKKNKAYYYDIFRFLSGAGRLNEFEKAYSTDFLIEAYVNGVEQAELVAISNDILFLLLENETLEWEKLRHLAFGYLTLEQIEKCYNEIEENNFRSIDSRVPINPYECYVEARKSWDNELINSVLQLVDELYRHGQIARAVDTFKRWFFGLKLSDIIFIYDDDENKYPFHVLQSTAFLLGKFICVTNGFSMLTDVRELMEKGGISRGFVYDLTESLVSNIVLQKRNDDLADKLGGLEVLHLKPIIGAIKTLLSENRLEDMQSISKVLHDRLLRNPLGTMLITFMEIISTHPAWTIQEKEELWNRIEPVTFDSEDYEEEICFSIYAVLSGYLSLKPYTICAKDMLSRYMERHKHYNGSFFTVYFNNLCLIGKWMSLPSPEKQYMITPSELESLMRALFDEKWSPNDRGVGTYKLLPYILKAYIMLSKGSASLERRAVDHVCEDLFASNPVNYLLDAGIFYYHENHGRMVQWFDYWLGEDGVAWSKGLYERNQIVSDLRIMRSRYHLEDLIDFKPVMERAQWSVVGYISHKEYSCDYLLDWYKSLAKESKKFIKEYAEKVKAISDQVSLLGDNRIEYAINEEFYNNIFQCDHLWLLQVLRRKNYLAECFDSPDLFASGLIGFINSREMDEGGLLEIWAIGTAILDWKEESERSKIYMLQCAVEACAERSGIKGIRNKISLLSPAYVDPSYDDHKIEESKNEIIEKEELDNYYSGEHKGYSRDLLWNSLNSLYKEGAIGLDYLFNVLRRELSEYKSSFMYDTLIENLVSILPKDLTDPIIQNYLHSLLDDNSYNLTTNFSLLVLWEMKHQNAKYKKDGMDELVKMHRSWITSCGHFKEQAFPEEYNYAELINWETASNIGELFYQFIKILIISSDSDATRIALSGLFSILRINSTYIDRLELDWHQFHFLAKEWIMMIYELLWYMEPGSHDKIMPCIKNHCIDEDFNIALYANILLENILGDDFSGFQKKDQNYFSEIPSFASQRFFKVKKKSNWISSVDYIQEVDENIEEIAGDDLRDVEARTILYSREIKNIELIPIKRRKRFGCTTVVDTQQLAYLRVLYKDWLLGRWDGFEHNLARELLTASEPYILLYTSYRWPFNSGRVIDNIDGFIKSDDYQKKLAISNILSEGILDDETVVAGSVIDYNYNEEIFGFLLCYFDIPEIPTGYITNAHEKNARMLFFCRDDFMERRHVNLTLHYSGIESFMHGNILCGFSKVALQFLEWRLFLSKKGLYLLDNSGQEIGRFESYYGNCGEGISNSPLQPFVQRWVIKKAALSTSEKKCLGGISIKTYIDYIKNSIFPI